MPAILKTYRLEALVEVPSYIEQLRFQFMEEFEFLGYPPATLSHIYYQFAEMFFVIHYNDDGMGAYVFFFLPFLIPLPSVDVNKLHAPKR